MNFGLFGIENRDTSLKTGLNGSVYRKANVVVNQRPSKVFMTPFFSNSLSKIYILIYCPENDRVYGISYLASNAAQLVIFNPNNNTVEKTITLPSGLGGTGLIHIPGTNFIYIGFFESRHIIRFNITNETTTVLELPLAAGCNRLLYNPITDSLWSANYTNNRIDIINLTSFTYSGSISVGSGPTEIEYSPSTQTMYVSNFSGNSITVLNASTGALVTTITSITSPYGMAYVPSEDRIFLISYGVGAALRVLDPNTNTISPTTIPTIPSLRSFDIVRDTVNNLLYLNCVNNSSSSVVVVDPVSRSVIRVIGTYFSLYFGCFDTVRSKIYFPNFTDNMIEML